MSLDAALRVAVAAAVAEAVQRELALQFARFEQPPDLAKTFSVREAADFLGVSQSCIRERVREGRLHTIQLGKYARVPYVSIRDYVLSELERRRAQSTPDLGAFFDEDGIDDDISQALGLSPAKKKPRREPRLDS